MTEFESIANLLEGISNVSSRNVKEASLKNYANKDLLKQVLLYAYNPDFVYGINKAGIQDIQRYLDGFVETIGAYPQDNSYTIIDALDYLLKNNTGSDDAKRHVARMLYKDISYKEYCLFEKIVLKDLRAGINIELINKAFTKLIPVFKTQLCKPYDEDTRLIYKEYICQYKLDGVRCITVVLPNGSVYMYSRTGTKISGYDDIELDMSRESFRGYVFDGELIAVNNFKATMEGLFAQKEDKKSDYFIYDCMTLEEWNSRKCHSKYYDRYNLYRELVSTENNVSKLSSIVALQGIFWEVGEDIRVLDKQARDKGYEGLVLKGVDSEYTWKRDWNWIKYKSFKEDDFEVVDMEEGEGKYEGMLGALVVTNASLNWVRTKIGTGFSDEERKEMWVNKDDIIGDTVSIQYQEITSENKLRCASFIKRRTDLL